MMGNKTQYRADTSDDTVYYETCYELVCTDLLEPFAYEIRDAGYEDSAFCFIHAGCRELAVLIQCTGFGKGSRQIESVLIELVCIETEIFFECAEICLTPSDPMDCSLPGSSIHGFSRQEYWSGVPLPSPWRRYRYSEI